MKDHEKLGTKGHVVRVKPGHMRHTLYPNRQAVYATDENLIRYINVQIDEIDMCGQCFKRSGKKSSQR
jgi:ribosomal protein L9